MEIVFFHRKSNPNLVSIEASFEPIIRKISEDNYVRVYGVPYSTSNPYYMLKNIFYIRNHSTRTGINHITGDIHYGILGLIGRKSVLTIHDDYAIRLAKHGVLDKVYKYLFWFLIPVLLANTVVCITPSTLNNIRKLYNSKKLLVITHHVVPPILKDVKKTFNKECPRLLQIGTEVNKNLESTLAVIKGMKCKLVVLKPMTEDQKRLAAEYSIEYENKWGLPYEDVVKEYQRCDIVLFPSSFEGLGIPIMEGQAAGRIVITTNKDPMKWVAGNGAVFLNDPRDINEYRDKLRKVIEDDNYRNHVIEIGKMNVKRFSLDESVGSYMSLYKSLL